MVASILNTFIALLVLSSSIPHAYAAPSQSYLRSCLQKAGVAFVDSSSGQAFSTAKKPYNQRLQYTPIAVASPSSVEQVAATVNCGRDAQYYINARGGGHSYAAMALGERVPAYSGMELTDNSYRRRRRSSGCRHEKPKIHHCQWRGEVD